MQSRQKVHELVFVRPRRRENRPVTKAKWIFWKQLDGERSGRTKRRHLMSCCKSPGHQLNWAPSHLQNPDGHTKRRLKKGLYIHIHWLASIDGTYTDEPDAAEGTGHQSAADASSSSLNTRRTSSPSSSVQVQACWRSRELLDAELQLPPFPVHFWLDEELRSPGHVTVWGSERRRRLWAAVSLSLFFSFFNTRQWCSFALLVWHLRECERIFNLQLIIFKCTSTKIKFVESAC